MKILSIIIPVLNEAYIINRSLSHLQSLNFNGKFEVIVVDGDKTGNTLREITAPCVKKVLAPRGRAAQMNKGAKVANGGLLLFLHADTLLAPNALQKIVQACGPHDIAGGAFSLGINSDRNVFRIIEKAVSVRTRLTRIPYGDQAFFIKKTVFQKLGGFKEIPLMEDVEFMRRLKLSGGKITILPEKAMTSARRWQRDGVAYCTVRNWLLITLYLAGVSPQKLVKFYR